MVASVQGVNSVNPGYWTRRHRKESLREELWLGPARGEMLLISGHIGRVDGSGFVMYQMCILVGSLSLQEDQHSTDRPNSEHPSGISSSQLGGDHGHGGSLPFQKSFEADFIFQQMDLGRLG